MRNLAAETPNFIYPHDRTIPFVGAKALIFATRERQISRSDRWLRTLFGYQQVPEVEAVFPVLRRDGNTQIYPHCLDLIGGRRDDGESPWETVVREAEEEIGADLTAPDALCLFAERYSLRGLAGLDQGPDCPEEENMGVFLVVRLDDGFPPMRLGDEGEGLYLTTPSEFLSRKDAWPALQELTRRYVTQGLGIEVKL